MPKHINAASRVHGLIALAAARTGIGTQPAVVVWAQLLGMNSSSNDIHTAFEVAERLLDVRFECESIEAAMKERGFSDALYAPQLSRVLNAAGPLNLGSQWQQTHTYFTVDVLQSLAFCSEILPHEEDAISADDLAAITALATELEALLAAANIPNALRHILEHQLDLIHRALARYPVVGALALRQATQAAVGEFVLEWPEIQQHSGDPAVVKATSLWTKVSAVVDTVSKIERALSLGYRAWDYVNRALETMQLPPPGA